MTTGVAPSPPSARPRLRGVSHQIAFFVSLISGAVLVAVAPDAESRVEVAIYACSLSGLLGVSALLHRRDWPPRTRQNLRRLDHSMIFVLIAGTYTPFAMLAMPHDAGVLVLWIVWGGALAGVLLKMCWPTAPRWVGVPLYLILGWVSCKFLLAYGFPLDPKVYFISKLPVNVRPTEFIITGIVAILICLVATIFPAFYAARLRPSDGLRAE